MSGWVIVIGSAVRGCVFTIAVCIGIPLILFEYLSVTLGGSILGPLR